MSLFFPRASVGWGFRVKNRATDDFVQAHRSHPSVDAAKLRAFDAMIWMKDQGR